MKQKDKFLIFLVDDDPVFLEMLTDQLNQNKNQFRYNYEVRTFPVGELAVENMGLNPDVIILDYNLDRKYSDAGDGLETLRKIKHKNLNTEVIIISAQDRVGVVTQLIDAGAHAYIVKNESSFYRIKNTLSNIFESLVLKNAVLNYRRTRKKIITAMALFILLETFYITYTLV